MARWPEDRANPNCLFAAGLIHGWLRELFARSEVRAFRPFLTALRAASHVSAELLVQFDALKVHQSAPKCSRQTSVRCCGLRVYVSGGC